MPIAALVCNNRAGTPSGFVRNGIDAKHSTLLRPDAKSSNDAQPGRTVLSVGCVNCRSALAKFHAGNESINYTHPHGLTVKEHAHT